MAFNPDRFLCNEPTVMEPVSAAFGYGRRICPGRFMAEGQLWISIACILSVYEIKPGFDDKGKLIKTEAAFSSGLIWYVQKWLHFEILIRVFSVILYRSKLR
ncbi:hypothetical protein C8R41DRAFT_588109 [Lentinula lateritia]|uniref:Cytochrome P450 n=1 Tax=Lentinula lateritia TaxID=40482 RepID=A0ABQ8V3I5_9AGAR|nr:hypothetical protein C8R41DRAFT_588109 [Lentinula lateritia]